MKEVPQPYPLTKSRTRGVGVIITNKEFRPHPKYPTKKPLKNRECADGDSTQLRQTLSNLGYRPMLVENLTAKEMRELPDRILKAVQPGDDSIVIFCSSHGVRDTTRGRDLVFGVDGVKIKTKDGTIIAGAVDIKALIQKRLSPSSCPELRGKPKFVVCQACRTGFRNVIREPEEEMAEMFIKSAGSSTLQEPDDFIFAYPTMPGHRAYRSSSSQNDLPIGSLYITDLCRYLEELAPRYHLLDILVAVAQKEGAEDKPLKSNRCDGEGKKVQVRQIPNFDCRLLKLFFLSKEARRRYIE